MKSGKILFFGATILILLIPVAYAEIIHIPDQYETIQEGINASSEGDTVLVDPGLYFENIDFNGHNISLGSLFLTTGDSAYISQTAINGAGSGSVVSFNSEEDSTALITGFTINNGYAEYGAGIYCLASSPRIIRNIIDGNECFSSDGGAGGGIYVAYANPLIEGNVISNNYASGPLGGYGGGLYCLSQTPVIKDNVFDDNLGDGHGGAIYCEGSGAIISGNIFTDNNGIFFGGGIYCKQSNPIIFNNIIFDNYAEWADGGGIYCEESSPTIANTVFFQNTAGMSGGGIYCEFVSNPMLVNCIFWYNEAYEQPEIDFDDSSSPVIRFCNVPGGWSGEGNIDVDPMFRDAWNGEFHLMSVDCGDQSDSPCIDAGDPDLVDMLLDCSWGLGELRSDMGAYGGGDSATVDIDNYVEVIPDEFSLRQNYPNPFNASTVIEYGLPSASDVTIEVYDILGRRVETLVQGFQAAGLHRTIWDSAKRSSGSYFYRIQAGEYANMKKMMLIK